MARPDVLAVVAELVAKKARTDRARVVPAARLIDFGLDSVKALELVVDLEQALGLELADQELAGLATIGDLVRHLERRLGA